MRDPINLQNLQADRPTYGKWAEVASAFSDPTPVRQLFAMFSKANLQLPHSLHLAEFGSAEGVVGEYFKERLSKRHEVSLTIFDVVPEHLGANKHPETKKVAADLLNLRHEPVFELGIMRSVLHYFSKDNQEEVLSNVRNSLTKGGYLLLQAFVQNPKNLPLYLELNRRIGKAFQLISEDEILRLLSRAGFFESTTLGSIETFQFSSDFLKRRYELSDDTISEMRSLIDKFSQAQKTDFAITPHGFSVPVPYKVFLATN